MEIFFRFLIQEVKQNLLAQALELQAVGLEFLSPSVPLENSIFLLSHILFWTVGAFPYFFHFTVL